jgi:hypothetical protein
MTARVSAPEAGIGSTVCREAADHPLSGRKRRRTLRKILNRASDCLLHYDNHCWVLELWTGSVRKGQLVPGLTFTCIRSGLPKVHCSR